MNGERGQRLLELLQGGVGAAYGMTFVPEDALREVYWGVTDPHPIVAAAADLELDFVFIDLAEEGAAATALSLRSIGTAPFLVVTGPLGCVARENGWDAALRLTATASDPEAEWLAEATQQCAQDVTAACDAGAFAVVIAEDIADSGGLMVDPEWFENALLPSLTALCSAAADRGVSAVFHGDGMMAAYSGAIALAGFTAIHVGGMGWAAFNDLYSAARAADLAVIGGLEGEELRAGPLRAVRAGTQAAVVARGNGLLIADDGGLVTAHEVAALISAIQAARAPGTIS